MNKIFFLLLGLVLCAGLRAQNYTIIGNASQSGGCNCFQITPDQYNQAGAIYQTHTINLNNSFDYTFSNYFGCNQNNNCYQNADGMVFALTTTPNSLGQTGQSLGWGNGSAGSQPCSVGIEFDTYQNLGTCPGGECDPTYNELSIMADGNVCHCDLSHCLSQMVPIQASEATVYDCNWHTVRIVWDVNTGTLSVYFDGNFRVSYTDSNMVNDWFCGNPVIYWGWSGSTGGACSLQEVCIYVVSSWIAGINYESCSTTVQFTDVSTSNVGSVQSWAWNFGDGATSNQQNPLHTYPDTGSYYAMLIITDVSGCQDTFSHLVTIALPIALNASLNNPHCSASNGSIALNATEGFGVASGHGGYAFSWNTGQQGDSISGLEQGAYTVTVTDGVCVDSAQYNLSGGQNLSVMIGAYSDTICQGDSTGICTFSNFASYVWSPVNGEGNTQCIEAKQAGNYSVVATDDNGCTVESNTINIVSVEEQGTPVIITTQPDSICAGDSARICATSNFASYTWNTFANTPCIEAMNPGTYFLLTTNSFGCAGKSNVVTIQQFQPSVTISAYSDTICSGDSAEICASSNFVSYLWSNNATTACIEARQAGYYSLRVSDANGCMAQSNSVHIVNIAGSGMQVTISAGQDSICPGDSTMICPTSGFVSYLWSPAAGRATTNCIEARNTGNYYLIATTNNGCTAQSNTVSIIEREGTPVTITANHDSICNGDSAQICPTSGFVSYLWNNNATTNCIEVQSQNTYYLIATDNNGCTAQSNSIGINVSQGTSVTIGTGQDSICAGDSTQICPTSNFVSYSWSPAAGGASSSCIEAQSQNTYYLIATDNNGCTAQSNSIDIYVRRAPVVMLYVSADSICGGDSSRICSTPGFATYAWNPAGFADTSTCISIYTTGTYNVSVSDNNGCTAQSNTATINVRHTLGAVIAATADSICPGDSTQICATQTFVTYTWNIINLYSDCINTRTAGNYYVQVSDNNGCTAQSNTINIGALPAPNAVISAISTAICPGDSTRICAANGYPRYNWNFAPGGASTACIEAPNAGAYYVTITGSNGCSAESNHIEISTKQAPPVSLSERGDTLSVYNASNIQWYLNNNPINGATQNTYIARTHGSYSVAVTDSDGCTTFSSPIIYAGIYDISEDNNILIYPNPLYGSLPSGQAGWQLTVSDNLIGAQIEVWDDNGRLVYKSEIKTVHSEIAAPLAPGIYLLRVTSGTDVLVRNLVKL